MRVLRAGGILAIITDRMRTISPLRLLGFAIPFALAPMVFAAVVPSWIDDEFRDCMGIVAEDELDARIDLYGDYYDAMLDDLRSYRRNVRYAWEIFDETQRKTFLKQIDRELATQIKNRGQTLTDRLKSLKETRTDAEAACKQRQTDAKKFVAGICTSTIDCASGKVCSTEKGVCNSSCPFGSYYCPQACAGTCVKP